MPCRMVIGANEKAEILFVYSHASIKTTSIAIVKCVCWRWNDSSRSRIHLLDRGRIGNRFTCTHICWRLESIESDEFSSITRTNTIERKFFFTILYRKPEKDFFSLSFTPLRDNVPITHFIRWQERPFSRHGVEDFSSCLIKLSLEKFFSYE